MGYTERLDNARALIQAQGLSAVAMLPGPTLFYLTGLSFHLMERLVLAILTPNGAPHLVLPELERPKAEAASLDLTLHSYGEEGGASLKALRSAVADLELKQIGLEPLKMRYFEFDQLRRALPESRLVAADEVFTSLRLLKNEAEVERMQRAAEIAEAALNSALPLVKVKMTERELAAELTLQLLRAGSEPEIPFSPIVAAGPNAALPHAVPTDRPISVGETLIMDWGATYEGYMSDITRTFALAELGEELTAVHALVEQANAAGRAAVRPGVSCGAIDQAARDAIAAAGYGDHFIHRTGHGLGLEAHEPPFIRQGERTLLEPGMTFTVEPGVYLPGRGGVRVEDDLVVTADGSLSLTNLPRQLQIIG